MTNEGELKNQSKNACMLLQHNGNSNVLTSKMSFVRCGVRQQ